MNIVRILLLGGICLSPLILTAEQLQFEIHGDSGILYNPDTGAILFEKEAHTQRYPASITKVSVALLALKLAGDNCESKVIASPEALKMSSEEAKKKSNYTLPSWHLEPDGVRVGIKAGEQMTLRTFLEGMLIRSGNDAANVVADNLGPTIPVFMEQLNVLLKDIGCKNTTFNNPSGLHHPNHMTTAYDMALITAEALKYPIFCEIVSKPLFIRPKSNKQAAATFVQTNRLMRPGKLYYPKAIGVKTGWHSKARKTFIGAARSNGRTLIVVLLGYQDRNAVFSDAIKMFEAAFNQPQVERVFLKAGPQTFTQQLAQAEEPVRTYLKENLSLSYFPAEDPKVKCLLYWQPLQMPIHKDQVVGELHLVSDRGHVLKKAPLLAQNGLKRAWPHNWMANLGAFYEHHPVYSFLYLLIAGMSLAYMVVAFRRSR